MTIERRARRWRLKAGLVGLAAVLAMALLPSPPAAAGQYSTYIIEHIPDKVCKGKATLVAVATNSNNPKEPVIISTDFNVEPGPAGKQMWEINGETQHLYWTRYAWPNEGDFRWEIKLENLPDWSSPVTMSKWTKVVECENTRVPPMVKWGGDDSETTPGHVELQITRDAYIPDAGTYRTGDGTKVTVPIPAWDPVAEPNGQVYVTQVHHKYANTGTPTPVGDGTYTLEQDYFPSFEHQGVIGLIDRPIHHSCPWRSGPGYCTGCVGGVE